MILSAEKVSHDEMEHVVFDVCLTKAHHLLNRVQQEAEYEFKLLI
jgi:hypothetical protein